MADIGLTFSPNEIERVNFECFNGTFKGMVLWIKRPNKEEREWGDGYERVPVYLDPEFVETKVLAALMHYSTLKARTKPKGSKLWLLRGGK